MIVLPVLLMAFVGFKVMITMMMMTEGSVSCVAHTLELMPLHLRYYVTSVYMHMHSHAHSCE